VVTTFAGALYSGYVDGTGDVVRFSQPLGVAIDSSGIVYVADYGNQRIRKIAADGTVTTFAGSTQGFADGLGTAAKFNNARKVAVDSAGTVYVADNNRIRKITPSGLVTTLAGSGANGWSDGTGTAAQFNGSSDGIAVDSTGTVYISDSGGKSIRKVTPSGVVTTFAGSGTSGSGYVDGTGTAARFNGADGIAVDSSGTLYVADSSNDRIRKITPSGVVTTLAGSTRGFSDGTGTAAQFYLPVGIAVDSTGTLYVTDYFNKRIRKITPSGVVTTLAGSATSGYADGTGAAAQFSNPFGITVDAMGTIYVTDGNSIRMIK
jgi:sugar lactone lactonase YvrE